MAAAGKQMCRVGVPLAVVLTLGVLLVGACGSDGDDSSVQDGGPVSPMDDEGMMDDGDDGHMGGGHDESSDIAENARRIEVTATSFQFDPDQIRVETGEDVAIVLSSQDILHDLTIDELDAHVAADGGETGEGGFTAEEPGEYTYYCTVPGHREAGMEGTLVVE